MKQIDKAKTSNLQSNCMRSTRQRSLIIEALRKTNAHPTAAWIYEKVREQCPQISLGTVYRNLNLLKEKGTIRELKFGKNTARYDGNVEFHHHMVCLECGKLEDVSCTISPDLIKGLETMKGYKIIGHQMEFKGICPECAGAAQS